MVKVNVMQVRQQVLASPSSSVKPWLAFKGFCWECTPGAFYNERVYHLVSLGIEASFMGFLNVEKAHASFFPSTHLMTLWLRRWLEQ